MKKLSRKRGLILGAATTLAVAAPTPQTAAVPPAGKIFIDPAVQHVLDDVKTATASFASFSWIADQRMILQIPGKPPQEAVEESTHLAFRKPNLVSMSIVGSNTTMVVSDGKHLYAFDPSHADRYLAVAAAQGAGVLDQASQSVNLPLDDPFDMSGLEPGQSANVEHGPRTIIDDQPAQLLVGRMDLGETGSAKIFVVVGDKDHLIHRVTNVFKISYGTIVDTRTLVRFQANPPLDPSLFVFTPPPGAAAATSLEPPPQPQQPTYDTALVPGANPIPFQAKDLLGQTINLERYRGRVLLLDFWATWCMPCQAEIPSVRAAYRNFHSRGFDIVGISLDQPGERPALVSFLREHGMTWPQIYDGRYWNSRIAALYKVQAIPFTVLIGRDGKIAAVGARGLELQTAIRAALAGAPVKGRISGA